MLEISSDTIFCQEDIHIYHIDIFKFFLFCHSHMFGLFLWQLSYSLSYILCLLEFFAPSLLDYLVNISSRSTISTFSRAHTTSTLRKKTNQLTCVLSLSCFLYGENHTIRRRIKFCIQHNTLKDQHKWLGKSG